MSILKGQLNVAPTRGMPVDEKKTSGSVSSTSTETVQLYYNNAGTLTADAGQAAGVVVVGKLSYNNVKNVLGDAQGRKGDTSLSFTSTALTSEVGLETITPTFIEGLDDMIWSQRLAAIGAKLSNGQYVVDYARGVIYGKKTSTGATLTSTTYKYGAAASSGGSGAAIPNVDSYSKVAINLAAGADQQLVAAPGANKQIWVYGYHFMVNVAGTVSFQDSDDTALSGIMPFGATGGAVVTPSGNFAMPIWKLATNKALEVDVVTSELDGWLSYAIVSV